MIYSPNVVRQANLVLWALVEELIPLVSRVLLIVVQLFQPDHPAKLNVQIRVLQINIPENKQHTSLV